MELHKNVWQRKMLQHHVQSEEAGDEGEPETREEALGTTQGE